MVRQLKRQYYLNDGRVLEDLGNSHISNEESTWHNVSVLHRVDGPAVTYPSGYEAYWVHGIRHRIDGPSIIYSSGGPAPAYYLFGKKVRAEDYPEAVKKLNINTLAIYLIDSNDILRKVAEETIKLLRAKENDNRAIHKDPLS